MRWIMESIVRRILEVLECWVMGVSIAVLWTVFEQGVAGGRMQLSKRNNVHPFRSRKDKAQWFQSSEQITQFYFPNCSSSMRHDEC